MKVTFDIMLCGEDSSFTITPALWVKQLPLLIRDGRLGEQSGLNFEFGQDVDRGVISPDHNEGLNVAERYEHLNSVAMAVREALYSTQEVHVTYLPDFEYMVRNRLNTRFN